MKNRKRRLLCGVLCAVMLFASAGSVLAVSCTNYSDWFKPSYNEMNELNLIPSEFAGYDLKKNIKLFFKKLSAGDANGNSVVKDWRARVIAYRDVQADGGNWYVDNPFVRTDSEIEAQLDAIVADGLALVFF